MSAVRKFLFELDFERHPSPSRSKKAAEEKEAKEDEEQEREEEVIVPTFSEEDLEAARQSGFEAGRQEGVREAASAIEREIADALAGIVERLAEVFEKQREDTEDTQNSALGLVHALTAKVFPRMADEHGLGEIEAMATALLDRLRGEPRVAFTVNNAVSGPLKERLATALAQMGFDGEIEVVGDAALTAGDCRIEWSTGGARRDMKELLAEIDGIITGNMDTPNAEILATDVAEIADTAPAAEADEIVAPPDAGDEESTVESHGEQTAEVADGPEGTSDGGETPPAGGDGLSRPE